MSTVSNNIPFVPENTIDPAAGTNDALVVIDVLLQLAVEQANVNAPPVGPADGQRFIIGAAPTGAWVGHAGAVAAWHAVPGYWSFYAARYALALADSKLYVRVGATWAPVTGDGETFTTAYKLKLDGIQDNATANSTDTFLRNRANHTGVQAIDTVTNLQAALDAKIESALIGVMNGVASLGADGKIPTSQLPALAVNEVFTVNSQAAMLALVAQRGDVAIRSDLSGKPFMLAADAPGTLANWIPLDQALSVALAALNALTPAADTFPYFDSPSTAALAVLTPEARTLLGATTTDNLPEGSTNQYFLQSRVRQTPMTGLAVVNSPILGTDTPVTGLGKAQGQINAVPAATLAQMNAYGIGTPTPVLLTDYNVAPNAGIYRGADAANSPIGQTSILFNGRYSTTGAFQMVGVLAAGVAGTRAFARSVFGGTYYGYREFTFNDNPVFTGSMAVGGKTVITGGEVQNVSAQAYRQVNGNYGTFWFNDGSALYLMLTNSGDQYGTFNSLRPFAIDLATGRLGVGPLNVSGGIRPGQYTVATRPAAAANLAYEIDVTDAAGGPQRQRSNGTAWLPINCGAWTNVTLAAGFTAGATVPQYRIAGDCVEFRGKMTIDAALIMNTLKLFTTMPAGFRPAYLTGADTLLLGLFSPTATTPYLSGLSTGVFSVGAKGGFAAGEVIDLTNIRYSLT